MAMRYPGGLIATSPVNAAYPSGVWTQSQTIPYASQNVWQRDQYWRNTTLLLHGDGTNGAQNNTFLDSSSNNFTITRNGNTTQGAFTPYGANWSVYFNGTSNWLAIPNNTVTQLGTGNFTIEAWLFTQSTAGMVIVEQAVFDEGAGNNTGWIFYVNNGGIGFGNAGGGTYISPGLPSGVASVMNRWAHVALVRTSTTNISIYVDGVFYASTSTNVNMNMAQAVRSDTPTLLGVHELQYAGSFFSGYMSNFRMVKGTALYTSNFTPSTTPLTAVSGTGLLTCQSNRFVDNSGNNLSVSSTFSSYSGGSPSVQAFQPFPGPTTWSASVLGGSGYFDSSGDSLTQSGSTIFNFSGDYTVEFWIYSTGTVPGGGFGNIVGPTSGGSNVLNFGLGASNVIGSSSSTTQYNSSTFLTNYQWNHIAYCRTGSTLYILLNGARIATLTAMSGAYSGGSGISICSADAYGFKGGYLADVRVTSGAMLYPNSTYTVPTSPLTTTVSSGTVQLLTNFTNAGIFDNAQMNNLETVGNAQISTSVVKYGTGSMAFDGSGDYLIGPNSALYAFGTGDLTIEAWIYPTSTSSYRTIFTTRAGTPANAIFFGLDNGTLYPVLFTSVAVLTSSIPVTLNAWSHVALVRSSGTSKIYVNGVSGGSAADTNNYSQTACVVGYEYSASSYPWYGYIDDLRITKGVARYTANFTPPIARMPNQ